MSKEVYLIGCHVDNEEQSNLLRRLVSHLNFFKKDYVLVSHTILPSDIVEKSVGFIYDTSNPVFYRWELEDAPNYIYSDANFNILSKYHTFGSTPYYHVGVLRLLYHGIKYLQTLNYQIIHWIEYDTFPDFDRAEENKKLIEQGHNFIFHGLGCFFSFNSKNELKSQFSQGNNEVFLKLLKANKYVAEVVIMNDLFVCEPSKIYNSLKHLGDYSQNWKNVPVHWSLFQKENSDVYVFLLNEQKKEIEIDFIFNKNKINIRLLPNHYYTSFVDSFENNDNIQIQIIVEKDVYFEIKEDKQSIYDKFIKDTKVWWNA
jgi:hypothetical protein